MRKKERNTLLGEVIDLISANIGQIDKREFKEKEETEKEKEETTRG